ncbi:Carcinoembryonic antigen-related cell adhesion molecule 5 [Liparis tanakae]|uniref:Carcinoembryonic antigen-related cell adhesion molecule 5 n=1 Tax=Liparis tanakae TaxID=230148 RepID=A0A4Z2FPZ8_9TELE|nr:Carcinoembryonic antigen-related cell adhesion molecule 5 [Liparis tanakae]
MDSHSADGPDFVEISGVGVATVTIAYYFLCTSPGCTGCEFSWTRGNETTQGPGLYLQFPDLVPTQTLTCTARNPATGVTASVQKTVKVTAGPSNVRIVGPAYMTQGVVSIFRCVASCTPPCNYQWSVTSGEQVLEISPGDSLSLSPYTDTILSETLRCRVQEPVSQLHISKTLEVQVARISSVGIEGVDTVTMGQKYTFACSAQCNPWCDYTWEYMGKTYRGDQTQIPIVLQGQPQKLVSHLEVTISSDYTSVEPLTCVATNSLSGATVNGTKNLTVHGEAAAALQNPYEVLPASPGPAAAGLAFSLKCTGAQDAASVTWMKSRRPMAASERASFALDNQTLTFSPLLPEDDGVYQCVVAEGAGPPMQSIGYTMNVIYGPSSAVISGPDSIIFGRSYDYRCSASCYPTCVYTWIWGNDNFQGPVLSLVLEEPAGALGLICTAINPTTGESAIVQKTLKDGPSTAVISGPDSIFFGSSYDFRCSASCYPTCVYTWIWGNDTFQGPALSLVLEEPAGALGLICTAINPTTGESAITQKTLKVDPSDIEISCDSAFLTAGVASVCTCTAECDPACIFSWAVGALSGGELLNGQGSTLSVNLPPSTAVSEVVVICVALDPVLEVSLQQVLELELASVYDVNITGDSAVKAGERYTYQCSAECSPNCEFSWTFQGKHSAGDRLELIASADSTSELLTCEATNTLSNVTITATMNITVTNPFSVRPSSQAPPVEGEPFTLRCVGAQEPASITWLKNKVQMPTADEWVHFSRDNATVTFGALVREDDGVYRCVVVEAEGGVPTLSAGYPMQVNYGPDQVVIETSDGGGWGGPVMVLPGSTTELRCAAACFPACRVAWFYGGAALSTDASLAFTPTNTPNSVLALSCTASNPLTGRNGSAVAYVEQPGGDRRSLRRRPLEEVKQLLQVWGENGSTAGRQNMTAMSKRLTLARLLRTSSVTAGASFLQESGVRERRERGASEGQAVQRAQQPVQELRLQRVAEDVGEGLGFDLLRGRRTETKTRGSNDEDEPRDKHTL